MSDRSASNTSTARDAKCTVADPIAAFLDRQGVLVIDGGLATELEARVDANAIAAFRLPDA